MRLPRVKKIWHNPVIRMIGQLVLLVASGLLAQILADVLWRVLAQR